MIIYLSVTFFLLLIIFLTVLLNSAAGPFLKKEYPILSRVKVSVMVPARNEERNIGTCLAHLCNQNYKNLEIIVLDDQSEDRTAEIVREYTASYKHIQLLRGRALPEGWTGKNWACQQLRQQANGDILIFTDADTQHGPTAISRTVGWMQHLNIGMLSAFPQQITTTFAEKLIVPLVDFFVYGMLPLWMTYILKSPAFAAGNGQWLVFTKESYHKINGHEAVKSTVLEDVEFMRKAKHLGIKTLTLAGTETVYCRMYHTPSEVWKGFTKIFYGLTGHRASVFFPIELMLFNCAVLPFFLYFLLPGSKLIVAILALNFLIRAVMAVRFKHDLLVSIFLHPVSFFFASIIGLNSFYQFHWGHYEWKNRKISSNRLNKS